MRSLAVVPPVLLDSRERRLCFDNRNGLVEDPMAEYRERPLLNVWTEQVCSREPPLKLAFPYLCIQRNYSYLFVCFFYVGKRDFQGEVSSTSKEFWVNCLLS
jgi:hypothetical protein